MAEKLERWSEIAAVRAHVPCIHSPQVECGILQQLGRSAARPTDTRRRFVLPPRSLGAG
jgi:hypothetical protein